MPKWNLGLLFMQCNEMQPDDFVAQEPLAPRLADHISLALANLRQRETLARRASRDPLTGSINRRYLMPSASRVLGPLTRSLGGARCPQPGSSAAALLPVADSALYEAKHGGRDRVAVEPAI